MSKQDFHPWCLILFIGLLAGCGSQTDVATDDSEQETDSAKLEPTSPQPQEEPETTEPEVTEPEQDPEEAAKLAAETAKQNAHAAAIEQIESMGGVVITGKDQDGKPTAELFLTGRNFTDESIAPLKDIQGLFAVDFTQTAITDAAMEMIATLPSLQHLALEGANVTDEGVAKLQSAAALTDLTLDGTRATDQAMQSLGGMSQLVKLRVVSPRSRGFRPGAASPNQITNQGLTALTSLKNLEMLHLPGSAITLEIEGLDQLTNLKELNVDASATNDAGVANLTSLKLKVLKLDRTRITDAAMESVKEIKTLTDLTLDNTRITDKGLLQLKELPALTNLSLFDVKLSDNAIQELVDAESPITIYRMTD